jgi:hypothetical protein
VQPSKNGGAKAEPIADVERGAPAQSLVQMLQMLQAEAQSLGGVGEGSPVPVTRMCKG